MLVAHLIIEMLDRDGLVYCLPACDPSKVFLKELLFTAERLPDNSYKMAELPQYDYVKSAIAAWRQAPPNYLQISPLIQFHSVPTPKLFIRNKINLRLKKLTIIL